MIIKEKISVTISVDLWLNSYKKKEEFCENKTDLSEMAKIKKPAGI